MRSPSKEEPRTILQKFFKIVDKTYFIKYNKYRKGKTSNGYAKKNVVIKNNALLGGGRYFFMEITKSNRIIINEIMYSLSIAITSRYKR